MASYDAIILGAGHNGLILAAYLGKAGLKVVVVERLPVARRQLQSVQHLLLLPEQQICAQ